MKIENLNKFQDKIYELEGLVELLQQRMEKEETLMPLIESKLKTINSIFADKSERPEHSGHSEISENSEKSENSDTIPPTQSAPTQPAPLKQTLREKPKFCINDRFRFRRELFNNSGDDFDRTMELVAAMGSYDEAEDYFINKLDWDPEDETVLDFMEIMKQYFTV